MCGSLANIMFQPPKLNQIWLVVVFNLPAQWSQWVLETAHFGNGFPFPWAKHLADMQRTQLTNCLFLPAEEPAVQRWSQQERTMPAGAEFLGSKPNNLIREEVMWDTLQSKFVEMARCCKHL